MAAGGKAAIAAGHQLTAEAAADIIRDGGTVTDAAIAALWMACVCEPVLASPGGGGFAMIRAGGKTRLLDFFVDAPLTKKPPDEIDFREVFADFGTMQQGFHIGAGASATPGFVPGIFAMHEAGGRIPMTRLMEPAIEAARNGFAMTAFQAFLASVVSPILLDTQSARALHAPSGMLLGAGAHYANPDLADTLEAIGAEGRRIATEGEIAGAMLGVCQDAGHLAIDDLKRFQPEWREPLQCAVNGSALYLNPPPSIGGALIHAIIGTLPEADTTSPAELAQAIDTVDQFWREDPQNIGRLLGHQGGNPATVASRGTTHISVAGADGDAIAVTVSNGEGNGAMVPGCGFMVNNMLGEEDVNPGGFHNWREGERLSSMMAPTIVQTGSEKITAIGSGGSNRIRTAVLQVARNICAGMRCDEAVEAPRVHVEKGHLDFEDRFDMKSREALLAAFPDHRIWDDYNLFFGGTHIASAGHSGLDAAGDPRRAGASLIV